MMGFFICPRMSDPFTAFLFCRRSQVQGSEPPLVAEEASGGREPLYETSQPEVTIQGLRRGTPMCVLFWGEADT